MKSSLVSKLEQLTDHRRAQGTRHSLTIVILITIMAFMSQIYSLRGIEAFTKRNKEELIKYLRIRKERLPSYATIRRVLLSIDFNEIAEIFKQWVLENNLMHSEEWVSIDGKSIKGTLSDYNSTTQNFVSVVSAFTHNSGIVLMSRSYQNKKTSEIPIVEQLVRALDLEGITFTMDALHSKKNS